MPHVPLPAAACRAGDVSTRYPSPRRPFANVGVAADAVACFAGSRPSFARLAQSARREAARACEPGLVLQKM